MHKYTLTFFCFFIITLGLSCNTNAKSSNQQNQQIEIASSITKAIKVYDYENVPKYSKNNPDWIHSNISLQIPIHFVFAPSVTKGENTVKAWVAEMDSQRSSEAIVYRLVEYTPDFSKYREIRYLKYIPGWTVHIDSKRKDVKWSVFGESSDVIDIEEAATVRTIFEK